MTCMFFSKNEAFYSYSLFSLQDFLLICLEFLLIYGISRLLHLTYKKHLPEDDFCKIIASTDWRLALTPQLYISFHCIHLSQKLYESKRSQIYTCLFYRKPILDSYINFVLPYLLSFSFPTCGRKWFKNKNLSSPQ